jgi:putative transposase
MPQYRRAKINGSIFFFTVVLADRSSTLLVDEIDRLRKVYRLVRERRPFETIAICVLPDHIHAIWSLPEGDADFSTRWSLIKSGFSRGLEDEPRSPSKIVKREKASGNVATGSTRSATMPIWNVMSITFISTR